MPEFVLQFLFPVNGITLFYTASRIYERVLTIHAEPRDMEFGEEDVLSTICLKNARLCKMCPRTGLAIASPQTSFGVLLSRIHREMNA